MDCKKFHYWLTTRDIHQKLIPPDAKDHMTGCPECRSLFIKDDILEKGIASTYAPEDLPRGIEERISISLDHDRQNFLNQVTGKKRSAALAGAGLVAALIIFALFFTNFYSSPTPAFKDLNQITLQAATDHLKGNRYMSFDARETQAALSMLTKKLGFKVILPDLGYLGYTLVGGRLCAIGKCRAAYFVVEHDGKTGSLFIMDKNFIDFPMADGSRFTTNVKGCDTCIWKDHGQVYATVF